MFALLLCIQTNKLYEFFPLLLRPDKNKSPSATNGNKGTISRGSTLLEKESPFPASFKMITESPWRIRPAPRWSSFASCQAALSKCNPLCDISQHTVLINAFTCELLYHFKRKSQAVFRLLRPGFIDVRNDGIPFLRYLFYLFFGSNSFKRI